MGELGRRLRDLEGKLGPPRPIPTLQDEARRYVATFDCSPPRIREMAAEEAERILALGDGPRDDHERGYLEGVPPHRQPAALFLYRLLFGRPEGAPNASQAEVAYISG